MADRGDRAERGTCRELGRGAGFVAVLILWVSAICAVAADDRTDERRRMVETIEAYASSPDGGVAGSLDGPVLEAMRGVPRHEFVPAEVSGQAYADRPLPIGLGQTISQPYPDLCIRVEHSVKGCGGGRWKRVAIRCHTSASRPNPSATPP